MNNEIKEILNYFRKYVSIRENAMISEIEDYITNLQQENERLSKNQRYCKKGVFSLEYDKETLRDMVDDLQQENEKLKEENKHIFANVNDDQLLRSNAMNWAEAQDYKSRIEKATELIKQIFKDENWYKNYEYNDLENALKEVAIILYGRRDE